MSWNIEKPGDRINGPLTITGNTTLTGTATISGDLTVDTSTLKVDAANNRVGVNTATPSVAFDVVGDSKSSGSITALSGFVGSLASCTGLSLTTGVSGTLPVGNGGTGATTFTAGRVLFGGTSAINTSANLFWDNSNSRLGIGTASPAFSLDVSGDIRSTTVMRVGTTSGDTIDIFQVAGGGYVSQPGNRFLAFGTNNIERLRIDSNGNLGLGTATPSTGTLNRQLTINSGASNLAGIVLQNDATGTAFSDGSVIFISGTDFVISNREAGTTIGAITSINLITEGVSRATIKSTGQLRFVPLASDPGSAEAGDVYYNSTTNKLRCYNGSAWNDLF